MSNMVEGSPNPLKCTSFVSAECLLSLPPIRLFVFVVSALIGALLRHLVRFFMGCTCMFCGNKVISGIFAHLQLLMLYKALNGCVFKHFSVITLRTMSLLKVYETFRFQKLYTIIEQAPMISDFMKYCNRIFVLFQNLMKLTEFKKWGTAIFALQTFVIIVQVLLDVYHSV